MKKRSNFIVNALNSYQFKAIFLCLIIINIYAFFNYTGNYGFIYTFYFIYTNPWILCLLLLCLFFNTLNYCELYKKNYSYYSRNINRKSFIKEMSIDITVFNLIVMLLSFALTAILLFLKFPGDFKSYALINEISSSIYLIYMLVRINCSVCHIASNSLLYLLLF